MNGAIQGNPMKILVDFGSSHTFVSKNISDQLVGVSLLQVPISAQVANGQTIHSSQCMVDAE